LIHEHHSQKTTQLSPEFLPAEVESRVLNGRRLADRFRKANIQQTRGREILFLGEAVMKKVSLNIRKAFAGTFLALGLMAVVPPQQAYAGCVTGFGVCGGSIGVGVGSDGSFRIEIELQLGVWE
jgi:hypothetical protein